jgi:hypothetical protein
MIDPIDFLAVLQLQPACRRDGSSGFNQHRKQEKVYQWVPR